MTALPGQIRRENGLAFLAGALAMAWLVTASPYPAGIDSYYHIRMAQLLPTLGLPHAFPWLHWTFFREHFVSHHYGFHALLAPFVAVADRLLQDPVAGAKAAGVLAMGATSWMLWRVLRARLVPHALFWTVLLGLAPWHFWLRMSYTRAPLVALPLLLAAVLLCERRRPVGLGLLGAAFVNVYFGAVLFLLVPAAFVAGRLVAGAFTRRDAWLAAAAALGVAAGFAVSPYFPENLHFMKVQLVDVGLHAPAAVGNEWKPLDTWFFLRMSAPLAVVALTALLLRLRRGDPLDGGSVALLLLNVGFLALTLKARRFVEYWPAFALLNAADLARLHGDELAQRMLHRPALPRSLAFSLLVAAALLGLPGLHRARAAGRPDVPPPPLIAALDDLARMSPPGSLVFTDDWDLFPICFYHNRHNTYVAGLDPMFTAVPYPELWDRYRLITRGRTPAPLDPRFTVLEKKTAQLEDIRDRFGARYVLVTADHARFYRKLTERPDLFRLVHPDRAPGRSQPPVAVFEVQPPG